MGAYVSASLLTVPKRLKTAEGELETKDIAFKNMASRPTSACRPQKNNSSTLLSIPRLYKPPKKDLQ